MRGAIRLGLAGLTIAAAIAVVGRPPGSREPVQRALSIVLGPARAPFAAVLRLRAETARSSGRTEESVGLRDWALELDPLSTEAVLELALDLAFNVAATREGGPQEIENGAYAAIERIGRARALGNRDPRLLDYEAFLLAARTAPGEKRLRVLGRALASAEEAAAELPTAHATASSILSEVGALLYKSRRDVEAAEAFDRAEAHERLLEQKGDARAGALAKIHALRAEVCRFDPARDAPAVLSARLDALSRESPDDPLLAEARAR